ncbi:MAG: hypothetical protein HQL85_18705 [Magnetococcales bacterium]|nr:hypothetical protein [Magnetococcales bacterium]
MNTTAYNYSPHAMESLTTWARWLERNRMPKAAETTRELLKALKDSVKFMLPKGGKLFDSHLPTPGEMELFKLPYPVVAAEFPAQRTESDDIQSTYNSNICSKRIALALDIDARGQSDYCQFQDFPSGYTGATLIWPIDFHDNIQAWRPSWCGILEFRGYPLEKPGAWQKQALMEEKREMNNPFLRLSPFVLQRDLFLLGEIGENQVKFLESQNMSVHYSGIGDTQAESTAIRQMCSVLNCSNIRAQSLAAPRNLNKKREKKGKSPFFEYKVLEVDGTPGGLKSPHGGGSHASPRVHIRRGHIRHLPTHNVWVQACVVGDKKNGVIHKDYRVCTLPSLNAP